MAEQTNVTRLIEKVGERVYTLYCDMESPLNEAEQALSQFFDHIKMIKEAAEKAIAEKEAEVAEVTQEI